MSLRRLFLSTELSLSFAAVLMLMHALGVTCAIQLHTSNLITQDINQRWLPTVHWTQRLQGLMNEFRTEEFELILAEDAVERKPHEARLEALKGQIDKANDQFSSAGLMGNREHAWKQLSESWAAYLVEHAKIRKLVSANLNDSARGHSCQVAGAVFQLDDRAGYAGR